MRFVDDMPGQWICDRMNEDADMADLVDEMEAVNPELGARLREMVSS